MAGVMEGQEEKDTIKYEKGTVTLISLGPVWGLRFGLPIRVLVGIDTPRRTLNLHHTFISVSFSL